MNQQINLPLHQNHQPDTHCHSRSQRSSNLELLRIVCMFLVLLIHYVPSRLTPTPETVNTHFWDVCLNLELRSLSFVCVNCFILISGYFGIRFKWKSLASLLFQVLFYAIVAWIIGYVAQNYGFGDKSTLFLYGDHIKKAFVVRWFIGAYLLLYLLSPVINRFIENSSNIELGRYIIVFYIISTIYGYILKFNDYNEGMSVLALIGLYLIGAYLKRNQDRWFNLPAIWDLAIYIILGLILVVVSLIGLKVGITKSVYGYLNPIVIIQTIYLFLFFSKLKIGQVRWVNIAAASAFSVYCLHTHIYVSPLYNNICKLIGQYSSVSLLIAFGFFASIYVFCMLVDPLRNLLFKGITKVVELIKPKKEMLE